MKTLQGYFGVHRNEIHNEQIKKESYINSTYNSFKEISNTSRNLFRSKDGAMTSTSGSHDKIA